MYLKTLGVINFEGFFYAQFFSENKVNRKLGRVSTRINISKE